MSIAGIYKIAARRGIYIGSSIDILKRWGSHKGEFERNEHHSQYMQNVYNKYGIAAFNFEIVEIIDNPREIEENGKSRLINREQYWLDWLFDNHEPEEIFNTVREAGGPPYRSGFKQPQHVVDAMLEGKRKAGGYKTFSIRSPEGILYENISNLADFARQHSLKDSALRDVLAGRSSNHFGWTHPNTYFKGYAFVSPEGEVFEHIVSLKAFSDNKGLEYKLMHKVWKGERNMHKGWRKYTAE